MNQHKKPALSILGCGWTGKALAEAARTQYKIACLSHDIAANDQAGYYNCDTLIVAIPPRENYLEVLERTYGLLDAKTQVIFLSSVSWYEGKAPIVEAEVLTRRLRPDAAIFRLGGLMGYDRIAGKYTAGKTLPHDTMSRYIHRDDVVGIILAMIVQNTRSVTWDAVAPIQHPKSEIFAVNARRFGFETTQFKTTQAEKKHLTSDALIEALDYRFKFPDVMKFWQGVASQAFPLVIPDNTVS